MRGFGLQSALARHENEEPEGGLEDGPDKQKAPKSGLGMLGDAEAAVEDTEGCDEAEKKDAYADEQVRGDAGSDHGGGLAGAMVGGRG